MFLKIALKLIYGYTELQEFAGRARSPGPPLEGEEERKRRGRERTANLPPLDFRSGYALNFSVELIA